MQEKKKSNNNARKNRIRSKERARERYIREQRQVIAEIEGIQRMYPDTEWNGVNKHWCLAYFTEREELVPTFTIATRFSAFFFPTCLSCEEMLEKVGEHRYKKYILGI